MIVSLLSSLDSNLHGFKDHIFASETLSTPSHVYSQLLMSSLIQGSIMAPPKFSRL